MTEKKRRTPRQARAAATTDAILTAAFQLLERDGVKKLTTNHIAARAGVSIGTIYQYFRDKDDILAALAERHSAAIRDGIADLVIRQPAGAGTIRQIIGLVMQSFQGEPSTRAALIDAADRRNAGSLQHHHTAFLAALDGKAEDLQRILTPERAFVLTHAPVTLLRAALIESDLGLDPARLADELTRLLEAYVLALADAEARRAAGEAPAG